MHQRDSRTCDECNGRGWYWTEWNDRADADPELSALVIERPEEPDGTVCITCPTCDGTGHQRSACPDPYCRECRDHDGEVRRGYVL